MQSFNYTITDEVGIHARPAGTLAKKVKEYASTVVIAKGEKSAQAQKLMAVMTSKCYNQYGIQFEYSESRNRPDLFSFHSVISKSMQPNL